MKTVTFLGHQIPLESMRQHYLCNARGMERMAEKSLKTGKYNDFTTEWFNDKAKMYRELADNLK